jgi:hypothetical protein
MFLFAEEFETGYETHSSSYSFLLFEALSPMSEKPERESDHSPPSSFEIKNEWIYTSSPPFA